MSLMEAILTHSITAFSCFKCSFKELCRSIMHSPLLCIGFRYFCLFLLGTVIFPFSLPLFLPPPLLSFSSLFCFALMLPVTSRLGSLYLTWTYRQLHPWQWLVNIAVPICARPSSQHFILSWIISVLFSFLWL